MESIWNEFAKLVGRLLADRWLRRQGLSTNGGQEDQRLPKARDVARKHRRTRKTDDPQTEKKQPR